MELAKERNIKMIIKKHQLIGIMFALSGGTIFAVKDQKYYLGLIDTAYNDVFGNKANLFDEENFYGTDEKNTYYKDKLTWDGMLFLEEEYITDNAFGNEKLLNAFEVCRKVSNKLMETLEAVYEVVFVSGKKDRGAIVMARNAIQAFKKKSIEEIVEQMRILRKVTYFFNKEKREMAKEAVYFFLTALNTIITTRLSQDFEKKLEEKGWS